MHNAYVFINILPDDVIYKISDYNIIQDSLISNITKKKECCSGYNHSTLSDTELKNRYLLILFYIYTIAIIVFILLSIPS